MRDEESAMRKSCLTLGVSAGLLAASPASAFDESPGGADILEAVVATGELASEAPRRGRMLAAFAINDQIMTLAAYGRRARARAMDNADDVRHARAMGKVFTGAPQPALVTLEMRLHF
jgi:hypothetical protein